MKNLKEERLGQTKLMNCGENATIIEYNNANDITVKFDDGTIINTSYCAFNNNKVYKISLKEKHLIQAQQRLGQTELMNCGMKCTIIKYVSSSDITVEFEDGYISEHREYKEFLKKKIQNKNLNYAWLKDLTGQKFGRWTVLGIAYKKRKHKSVEIIWKCQCDCGKIGNVAGSNLKSGCSKSCGCLERELTIARNHFEKPIYPSIENGRSDLVKYLVNKEDTKYSLKSGKKIKVVCPKCGMEYTIKVCHFVEIGCKCPKCSDGISYPNKYMYCVVEQLVDKFSTEKKFEWSNGKKYDFYIKELNCIIEAHGRQHYEDCSWSTAKEQQKNDKYKYELAKINGIENYIVIDCRISTHDFIKNSILNNKDFLALFPNIEDINWDFYKDIHTRKYKKSRNKKGAIND